MLADSLLGVPEPKLLVSVLEVVLPELVAKRDEATMREFAKRMPTAEGEIKELAELLQDFACFFYTDVIFDGTVEAAGKTRRLEYFTQLAGGGDVQVMTP
eukprot:8840698-Pyramimonas_sp.AAC.2